MNSFLFYFLRDVEVTGVDAVPEQVLGAAALAGPEHTVVGLEQLTAGRRGHGRNQQRTREKPTEDTGTYLHGDPSHMVTLPPGEPSHMVTPPTW